MRGLLFTGGRAPDMELAKPLFGSYSLVVAADSGLCALEDAGLAPDFIVGDMDSLPDPAALDRYPRETVLRWPVDKDNTDTELALALLAEKGVDETVVVGGSGGRLDHLFAIRSLFDGPKPPALWISEENVVVAAGFAGMGEVVEVSGLGAADPVSVFPAGPGPHACFADGLHWKVDGLRWDGTAAGPGSGIFSPGEYSLSNRADGGRFTFNVLSGVFLVFLPLVRGLGIVRSRTAGD